MRINCHAHGSHAERNEQGRLAPPVMPAWDPQKVDPAEYVRVSEQKAGVDKVLLLDLPHVTFELQKAFGDYVIPAPMVDADTATPQEVDDLFKKGAKGIKFIGPSRSYGHEDYWPLYDVIRANRGLAVFHTGFLVIGNFHPEGLFRRKAVVDITDMRPAAIDRVARAFPDLKVLMAHFGNPWWEEAWKVIASHKNVYADLSGGTARRRSMDMWAQIFAPNGKLDTQSVGKLCFGTDGQSFMPDTNLGEEAIFTFYDELYERLDLPDELRHKIDRGNMVELIKGLEE